MDEVIKLGFLAMDLFFFFCDFRVMFREWRFPFFLFLFFACFTTFCFFDQNGRVLVDCWAFDPISQSLPFWTPYVMWFNSTNEQGFVCSRLDFVFLIFIFFFRNETRKKKKEKSSENVLLLKELFFLTRLYSMIFLISGECRDDIKGFIFVLENTTILPCWLFSFDSIIPFC